MWGIIIAFMDYKPLKGVFSREFSTNFFNMFSSSSISDFFSNFKEFISSKITNQKWIGFENFNDLFSAPDLTRVLINTLGMSVMGLFFGTILTLFFAVMINETKNIFFKKSIQTISYLPHFVSWVVASAIVKEALSTDGGIINQILIGTGVIKTPIMFLGKEELAWWIITFAGVWKSIGWGTIIYLAAMTSVDPQLYEAAEIDGASRIQRIANVTIPGIMPTIMILLILNVGQLLSGGFEVQYLFRNPLNYKVLENFGLYVFRVGIENARYSFGTAAGMFNSVVNIVLLFSANFIAKKLQQETLF